MICIDCLYIEFTGREIATNSTPDLEMQSTNNTTKSNSKFFNNSKTTKKKAVLFGTDLGMFIYCDKFIYICTH